MNGSAPAFVSLEPEHLSLLHGWLGREHVRAYWDDGDRTLEQVRAHYFQSDGTERFLMLPGTIPAGYLQAYPVDEGDDFVAWCAAADGGVGETWGLDLFLADPQRLGQGLGPHLLRAFVAFWQQERPHLRRVLLDPDPHNHRAVRAFAKAGFAPLHRSAGVLLLGLDLPRSTADSSAAIIGG